MPRIAVNATLLPLLLRPFKTSIFGLLGLICQVGVCNGQLCFAHFCLLLVRMNKETFDIIYTNMSSYLALCLGKIISFIQNAVSVFFRHDNEDP